MLTESNLCLNDISLEMFEQANKTEDVSVLNNDNEKWMAFFRKLTESLG